MDHEITALQTLLLITRKDFLTIKYSIKDTYGPLLEWEITYVRNESLHP